MDRARTTRSSRTSSPACNRHRPITGSAPTSSAATSSAACLYGGRLSLPAGILVIVIAGIIGTAVRAVAGFIGGWFDEGTMRLTEVFMAFPTIILAMAIAAALGPSLVNAVVAMVVVWWPNYAARRCARW